MLSLKKLIKILLLATTLVLSSCSNNKELERLTIDEAFETYKSGYRVLNNENFSTNKETYGLNEEAIIYHNGTPLVSWKFKKITPAIGGSYDINNTDGLRIELEITNYNVESGFQVLTAVSHIVTTMITDLGTEAMYYSSESRDNSLIYQGETDSLFFIVENEALAKDINKLYIRYYYIEDIFASPDRITSNHLQFELEVDK